MKGDVSREVGSIDDGDDEIIFAKGASQNTDISLFLFCTVMILLCVHFSIMGGGGGDAKSVCWVCVGGANCVFGDLNLQIQVTLFTDAI